jgi:hypothetical protein
MELKTAGEMAKQDYDELNQKIDLILNILSGVLVEADYLTKVKGLNKRTISQNEKLEKFNEIGKRKLLIKLESVPVVRARKRSKKRS